MDQTSKKSSFAQPLAAEERLVSMKHKFLHTQRANIIPVLCEHFKVPSNVVALHFVPLHKYDVYIASSAQASVGAVMKFLNRHSL